MEERIVVLEGRVETLELGLERVLRRLEPAPAAPVAPRKPAAHEPAAVSRPAARVTPAVQRAPSPRPARPAQPARSPELSPAPTGVRRQPPLAPAPTPAPRAAGVAVEDLLGGRVLAWVGGVAVLVGIALFFALAISNGWIGPAARTLLAGAGGLALLTVGLWLHAHKGRTDAALASVSTAIAGLFATVTVAAQVYHLVPALAGLLLAGILGGFATVLAVRWEAKGVGALGIVGTLLGPVLVGAPSSAGSMAFLAVAAAAAAAVLIWQRWSWLAFALFALTTPQWISWLAAGQSAAAIVTVLAVFGVINVTAAVGYELRLGVARLTASSSFLLAFNALALGVAGWVSLTAGSHATAGKLWLTALAAAHFGIGLASRRSERISADLGLLGLVLGVSLADVAYGLTVHGPALAAGWAGGAVIFALIRRRSAIEGTDGLVARLGLGAHIGLALVRAIVVDAPPSAVAGHGGLLSAGVALCALGAACFTSARLAEEGGSAVRIALDSLGIATLAYLTAIELHGATLALAWAGEGAALAQLAARSRDRVAQVGAAGFVAAAALHVLAIDVPPRYVAEGAPNLLVAATCVAALVLASIRTSRVVAGRGWQLALGALAPAALAYLTAVALDGAWLVAAWALEGVAVAELARRTGDELAKLAAPAFLGLASLHATSIEAPPRALVYGAADIAAAAGALVAVAAASARVAQVRAAGERERIVLAGSAAVSLLYGASVAIVSSFQSGTAAGSQSVLDLAPPQQGQMLLSCLWGLVGLAALVLGLRKELRLIRLAGLGLLLVTIGKVFLFDLATLTSVYRVVSFVGLGLLLLAAAFTWQRMRPRALPDLRTAPPALR